MGFEDVKTDGLLVEKLKDETKRYNKIYFGEGISLYNQHTTKGQLQKFTEAKMKYMEQQFAPVKKYFSVLGWDYTEKYEVHTFRANESVSVSYKYGDDCYIEFKNGDIRKTYGIEIQSDFRENTYYGLDTSSRTMGSNQYVAKGGEATRPQMIKERLEEIKAVVEYNESLKGEYNFRVTVDKNASDSHRYTCESEWVKYTSVMDVINEISNEYF